MGAGLQALVFAAREFQSFLLIETFLLALRHRCLALFALLSGTLVLSRKAFELQASHRKSLAGSRVFLGQLALFVIERECAFLLFLLLRAHVLQLFAELRGILFEFLQRARQRVSF